MKYKISEEILRSTNCRNSFHCISGDMEDVCKFFNTEEHPIVVNDCSQRACDCPYCKPFNSTIGFCKCPTRLELYKRYGI